MDEYESDKKPCKRGANKIASASSSQPAKIMKQSMQTTMEMFGSTKQRAGSSVSKAVVEKKILSLVANGLLPLSVVELEEFKDLLTC